MEHVKVKDVIKTRNLEKLVFCLGLILAFLLPLLLVVIELIYQSGGMSYKEYRSLVPPIIGGGTIAFVIGLTLWASVSRLPLGKIAKRWHPSEKRLQKWGRKMLPTIKKEAETAKEEADKARKLFEEKSEECKDLEALLQQN